MYADAEIFFALKDAGRVLELRLTILLVFQVSDFCNPLPFYVVVCTGVCLCQISEVPRASPAHGMPCVHISS